MTEPKPTHSRAWISRAVKDHHRPWLSKQPFAQRKRLGRSGHADVINVRDRMTGAAKVVSRIGAKNFALASSADGAVPA